jgi:hypothetical protein
VFSFYNLIVTFRDECSRATPMSCIGLGAIHVFDQVRWGMGKYLLHENHPLTHRDIRKLKTACYSNAGGEPWGKAQWSSWLHSASGVVSLLHHGGEKLLMESL